MAKTSSGAWRARAEEGRGGKESSRKGGGQRERLAPHADGGQRAQRGDWVEATVGLSRDAKLHVGSGRAELVAHRDRQCVERSWNWNDQREPPDPN